jgi:hypothetical protein
MTFRRLSREYIGVTAVLCLAGFALTGFADPPAQNEKPAPAPVQLAVVTPPKSPASEVSTNAVSISSDPASSGLPVDRVRRIQVLQRIEPEIIQSSPVVRPAPLD